MKHHSHNFLTNLEEIEKAPNVNLWTGIKWTAIFIATLFALFSMTSCTQLRPHVCKRADRNEKLRDVFYISGEMSTKMSFMMLKKGLDRQWDSSLYYKGMSDAYSHISDTAYSIMYKRP